MKTFCCQCEKETESKLLAEVRECECGVRFECRDNPETNALRAENESLKKQIVDLGIKNETLLSRYSDALDTMRQYMEEGDDYD
jgi:hypothetical protein